MPKETTDPQSEEQLLSRFFKDPSLLDGGSVTLEVFSGDTNRRLAETLMIARRSGEKICSDIVGLLEPDLRPIAAKLEMRPLGGASNIALVESLEKTRQRRRLAQICSEGYERVMESDNPGDEVEVLRGHLGNLHKESSQLQAEDSCAPCLRIMDDFEWRVTNPGKVRGLRFGRPKCEAYIDGLKPSHLYVRGAGTSVGKTADLCNDLHYFGENGIPAHTTTMEMTKDELISRLISLDAKASLIKGGMPNGGYSDYDVGKIQKSIMKVSNWGHLHWLSNYRLNIDEWARSVRQCVSRFGVKVAYLDYLQCLAPSKNSSKDSRAEQVSYAAYMCKEVAKECGIPVILLSQLKRIEGGKWDGKEGKTTVPWPKISDLKESGDIENAADVIELLHRDRENEPDKLFRKIVKQRNGAAYHTFAHTYSETYYGITEL